MRKRLERTWQQTRHWCADQGQRLSQRLQAWGLWPTPVQAPEPLERAVQAALRPVEPPTSFRESLRSNLNVAVQRQAEGLVIEYPKPFREAIILSLFVGLGAALIAVLVFLSRARSGGPR
jgi:hypothetical protein